VDAAAYTIAVATGGYAASLCMLELLGFQNGHVVVTCVWAAAGLAAAAARWRIAFAWLAAVAAKAVFFDIASLTHTRYGISLVVVGAAVLAAALLARAVVAIPFSLPLVLAGALVVYGASLAILEAAQLLSPEDVHTNFQRGQTMVSAFWGVLALVFLYAGLRRRRPLLRGGGFVLFAVSLGKIFLFDLASLSSAQRALSFLAVGAVLLLGGFFYQRLSAQFDARQHGRPS